MKIKTQTKKSGAVLLIAIMVASVALAVGLGVYNRTYKELVLGSFWKQTQVAFAAADAGVECAIYWDLHTSATPKCFGTAIGWAPGAAVPSPGVSLDIPGGTCSNIVITKTGSAPVVTLITTRGYNATCAAVAVSTTNPRIVERGLKIQY